MHHFSYVSLLASEAWFSLRRTLSRFFERESRCFSSSPSHHPSFSASIWSDVSSSLLFSFSFCSATLLSASPSLRQSSLSHHLSLPHTTHAHGRALVLSAPSQPANWHQHTHRYARTRQIHIIWSPFLLKCQGRAKLMLTIRFYQHLKTGPALTACKSEWSKTACDYIWFCQWVSYKWINQGMFGNVICHPQ